MGNDVAHQSLAFVRFARLTVGGTAASRFRSRYAARGVGLVHLQRLLGHRDPKLTAQVYTHLGASELRDALKKSESRSGHTRRDVS